jgi:cell division protein FtsL
MSSPAVQIRSRVTSLGEAAVSRARLTVVPQTRTPAARVPFVFLVSLVLLTGVIGLLMFNTHMQQASFTATRLDEQAATMAAREQALKMELDDLRNPQRVALQAQRMGMVVPNTPVFLSLDGEVVGTPTPATPEEGLRLNPAPRGLPAGLRPSVEVVEAPPAP